MKLGLKEIGAVAALATAGCTSPIPEDAKYETPHPVCAVPDAHRDTITEEMVESIRKRCAQIGRDERGRVFDNCGWWGGSSGSMQDAANQAAQKVEKECLALHGLTLEGDITDTVHTDQPFESNIKTDGRRRGKSTFKIDGAEFGGGGLTSEI